MIVHMLAAKPADPVSTLSLKSKVPHLLSFLLSISGEDPEISLAEKKELKRLRAKVESLKDKLERVKIR